MHRLSPSPGSERNTGVFRRKLLILHFFLIKD
jgi:hypothetical protein